MTPQRRIIGGLLSLLLLIFLIEFPLLRGIDPLGIYAYVESQGRYLQYITPDDSGYALQPGTHDLGRFTMTVTADGFRTVPTSAVLSNCVLVFVGDSITMGQGVTDDETFAALLAIEWSTVRMINAGRSGYEAGNVERLIRTIPAQGYVWYMTDNDVQTAQFVTAFSYRYHQPPAIGAYLRTLSARPQITPDLPAFRQVLRRLMGRDDLLILTAPHAYSHIAEMYGARSVPAYSARISLYDGHPNAEGHQQIARALQPHIANLIAEVCP